MNENSKATRLRIRSDGSPKGTRVETEDGTLVRGIQGITWSLTIDGFARVKLEVLGTAANLVGLVEVEGQSMLGDPEAIPELADPQEAPADA